MIAARAASKGVGGRLKSVPDAVHIYAAFLRAVNVGKHNRVRMADVRTAIAGLGYEDVRTYLPTGNIALRTTDVPRVAAARLEGALADLGLRDVDVMVRTREEVLGLAGTQFEPYPADEYRRLVIFTRQPVDVDVGGLPLELGGVTFLATGCAFLAVTRKQSGRPVNANALVERQWKTRATTRFWNVIDDFRSDLLTSR